MSRIIPLGAMSLHHFAVITAELQLSVAITKFLTEGIAVLTSIRIGIIAHKTSTTIPRADNAGVQSGALRKLAME